MDEIFPNGCAGAVSLTYDDGIDAHLDHAMPALEEAGLRGTFYVPTHTENCWARRTTEWRLASQRGHEIANHTQRHPCSRSFPWVARGQALEDYDLARVERELRDASEEIGAVTGRHLISFAYTCCQDFVGENHESYRPLAQRLFPVCRGGREYGREPPILADPLNCDFSFVPAWMLWGRIKAEEIVAFIDSAIALRRWAVLMFHGVGGGHAINVTRQTHQVVCQHIAAVRDRLWCDTFLNVGTHLRHISGQLWTGNS